jgi:eukaryotic-like serine/threonine-protein kinase
MRRLLGIVLRLMVLVVVFMVSALVAMRFAIHGRQVAVPKLVGMTPTQAKKTVEDRGLLLDDSDRFYSTDVPEGRIMSQVPSPGEQVRSGWRVRVAESMGPQRVVVPDLVGGSERAAEINVRRRGLEIGAVALADIPGAPADEIAAQSPPANATNISSPKVSLLVASPENQKSFVMPDLRGRNEDAVVNVIVAAGLRVGQITTQQNDSGTSTDSASTGARRVTKTIPAAGQRIYEGQSINLEVTQ